MTHVDKTADYSRDLARGVCMSVESMTGVQPRKKRVWPGVLVVGMYTAFVCTVLLVAFFGGRG